MPFQSTLFGQLDHVSESGTNPNERVDVDADLVVGGNANQGTADLEVLGDAQVNGDLDVFGELKVDGNSPLVSGSTVISQSHFYRDGFLVSEFNNFLHAFDRRFQLTPSGDFEYVRVDPGDFSVLFDGVYDQPARIQILEGDEFRLELDFSRRADGSVVTDGIIRPLGYFYVSFFNRSVPANVRLELAYKDGTTTFVGASALGTRRAVWFSNIPNKSNLQRLTVVVLGGVPVNNPTRLQELSYHLLRPRESGGFVSKYGPEELYFPLSLYDANYNKTIELNPETGTIIISNPAGDIPSITYP